MQVLKPRALKRHRKRAQRREPGKRRKSWPTSSVSWPRANAPKGSRWNRSFSRRAGKSTRSRAARKRPLLSVRRLGAHLAAVQRELDAMRRVARDGSAQARAIADKQERALEGQRQIADGLARELAAVQREVEGLKAKATLASPAKAADVKAGLAAEASLADARRVIDQERQKAGMLERDLAAARQSLAALEATADQAAAAQATAMRDLQAAEAATKRLSEALLLQRQRADEATGELKTARQERDAAKQEAIRVATAQREALEDEQGKAISLARELAAARKEVDSLKSRGQRRIARVENAPKARATMGASASGGIRSKPRSGRKSELREVRKTEVRRSSRSACRAAASRRVCSPRGRQCRISPTDHVIAIGFGGVILPMLLKKAAFVAGAMCGQRLWAATASLAGSTPERTRLWMPLAREPTGPSRRCCRLCRSKALPSASARSSASSSGTRSRVKKTAHTAEQERPDVVKRRQAWLDGQFDLIPSDWSLSMRLGRPPTWRAAMAAVREASGSGSARRMAHWKTPTSTEKGVPARASCLERFSGRRL